MVFALISLKSKQLLQDSRTEVLAVKTKRESRTRGVKTNFGQCIIGQAILFRVSYRILSLGGGNVIHHY